MVTRLPFPLLLQVAAKNFDPLLPTIETERWKVRDTSRIKCSYRDEAESCCC